MYYEYYLKSLIKERNHRNVLRLIRAEKIFDPELVLYHGICMLGNELERIPFYCRPLKEFEYFAFIEQICIAALEIRDQVIANKALKKIKTSVGKNSVRYRRLLGLCLESSNELDRAIAVYNNLLKENRSNSYALKRKYCVIKTKYGINKDSRIALNEYLEHNGSDVGAWAEMAKCCCEVGDYLGATYCYEEILLFLPMNGNVHCSLGELYATLGGKDNLLLARKHLSQCLDMDPSNLRGIYGLIYVSESFIEEVRRLKGDKECDVKNMKISKELIKFGVEKLNLLYKNSPSNFLVRNLLSEYIT